MELRIMARAIEVDARAGAGIKINVGQPALDGAIDEVQAAPVAHNGGVPPNVDVLASGAFRDDLSSAVDGDRHARSQINRRTGENGQVRPAGDDEVGTDRVRAAGRAPDG